MTMMQRRQKVFRAAGLLGALLLTLLALLPGGSRAQEGEYVGPPKYVVFSQPTLRWLGYVKLPDPTVRTLVMSGLIWPQAVCIDQTNMRLFVTDKPAFKIYWYQLIVLPDGKLITDGTQHVAVQGMVADRLTTDNVGNLYYSGTAVTPPPWKSYPSIFKHNTILLATGGVVADGTDIYTRANNEIWEPSSLATDNFNIWWGNGAEGLKHGSLAKGSAGGGGSQKIADNEDVVRSVVITPRNIFYGGGGKIFGIPKDKVGAACGEHCHLITDQISEPNGMVWDGDGTMYVADYKANKVYSFPSGALQKQEPTEVFSGAGAWDIDIIVAEPAFALRRLRATGPVGLLLLGLLSLFPGALL